MPVPTTDLAVEVTWWLELRVLVSLAHRCGSLERSPGLFLSLHLEFVIECLKLLLCLNRHLSLQGLDLLLQVSYLLILFQTLVDRLLELGLLLALLDVELADEGAAALELHLELVFGCLDQVLVVKHNVLEDFVRLRISKQ